MDSLGMAMAVSGSCGYDDVGVNGCCVYDSCCCEPCPAVFLAAVCCLATQKLSSYCVKCCCV